MAHANFADHDTSAGHEHPFHVVDRRRCQMLVVAEHIGQEDEVEPDLTEEETEEVEVKEPAYSFVSKKV